ncbi:MAG: hypothetical protein Q6368_003040 [Candidatus Baldrarchaeota archaeon]
MVKYIVEFSIGFDNKEMMEKVYEEIKSKWFRKGIDKRDFLQKHICYHDEGRECKIEDRITRE